MIDRAESEVRIKYSRVVSDATPIADWIDAQISAAVAAEREATRKQTDYSIALQRAIEFYCSGQYISKEVSELCPHHAGLLVKIRARGDCSPRVLSGAECDSLRRAMWDSIGNANNSDAAIRKWYAGLQEQSK